MDYAGIGPLNTRMKWIANLTDDGRIEYQSRPFGLPRKDDALRELCARYVARVEAAVKERVVIEEYGQRRSQALDIVGR